MGEVARINRVPHVAAMKVGVHPVDFQRFVPDHRLKSLLRLPMKLHKMRLALGIHQPEGVDAEALHEAEGARDSTVGHLPHDHMHGFRRQGYEIPEVVVRALRLWKTAVGGGLHGMDQVGKFDRVLNEEHRDIVTDKIPVAFLGIKLRRKATHIASQVG